MNFVSKTLKLQIFLIPVLGLRVVGRDQVSPHPSNTQRPAVPPPPQLRHYLQKILPPIQRFP